MTRAECVELLAVLLAENVADAARAQQLADQAKRFLEMGSSRYDEALRIIKGCVERADRMRALAETIGTVLP